MSDEEHTGLGDDDRDALDAPDAADSRLLRHVAATFGPDPAPEGMAARLGELFALRDLDRDLVALLDEAELEAAGTRGATATVDRLEFELADGTLSLEVVVDAAAVRGQVLTGEVVEVSLESPSGSQWTASVDGLGRFRFDAVTTGPVRLVLRGRSAQPSSTDWFLI